MKSRLAVLGMLAALSACASDLTPAWKVTKVRIFGARTVVGKDSQSSPPSPTRSNPKPGESFTLHQYLVAPHGLTGELATLYDMKIALCLGLTTPDGNLACAGELDVPTRIHVDSQTELHTDPLTVPPLDALLASLKSGQKQGEFDQVAIFGAVCAQGKVERVQGTDVNTTPPSKLFRCTGNDQAEFPDPLAFTLSVSLDLGKLGQINHNPNFPCTAKKGACLQGVHHAGEHTTPGAVVLVGPKPGKKQLRSVQTWNEYDGDPDHLPAEGCEGSGLPQVQAGAGEHLIRLRFDPEDREQYTYDAEEYGKLVRKTEREELLISHAVTDQGGKLDRYFSVLARDNSDAEAEIEISYQPPKPSRDKQAQIPQGGRLVRFFFAVGDERGGLDFTTRELCLLPP